MYVLKIVKLQNLSEGAVKKELVLYGFCQITVTLLNGFAKGRFVPNKVRIDTKLWPQCCANRLGSFIKLLNKNGIFGLRNITINL